jgi:hypothetical protein
MPDVTGPSGPGMVCTSSPPPAAGPPATPACDASNNSMNVWSQIDATGTCGWMCEPMPTYTQPSKADQIQDFALEFFDQCDVD